MGVRSFWVSWREWALGFADALPPRECAALLQLRIGGGNCTAVTDLHDLSAATTKHEA